MTRNELPSFEVYCDNTTGHNALVFDKAGFRVWFSYRTPVAFKFRALPLIVRENDWGPTTGKHLNAIDRRDTKGRVRGEVFEELLNLAQEDMHPELRQRLVELGKVEAEAETDCRCYEGTLDYGQHKPDCINTGRA